MKPAIINSFNLSLAPFGKTFEETLAEGFRFEVRPDAGNTGIRSLVYAKQEHSLIISHTYGGRVHVLDLSTGKLRWYDHHSSTVRCIQISGNEIITASWDSFIGVTDFDSLKSRMMLSDRQMGRSPHVCISSDKTSAYSYSYDSDKAADRTSNTVRQWNMSDGRLMNVFMLSGEHLSSRRCGACEEFGNRLFAVADTGHLDIINPLNGNIIAELDLHDQLQSICILPDHRLIATGGSEGNIYLCDFSGKLVNQKIKAHTQDVTQMILHPTLPDTLVSISFDGTISIWKLPDIDLITSVNANRHWLWCGQIINNLLLAGGTEGDIWIYDIQNPEKMSLVGKLLIDDESCTFLPSNSNLFYSDHPEIIRVRREADGEVVEGQFANYLINSCNRFKILSDLFSIEKNCLSSLQSGNQDFYQLTK
jgi:WD40 repeat protein